MEASYRQRISELQARYRLVPMRGPFFWACNGQQANELVVTFFATEPATLIAERGDQSVLMTQVPAASDPLRGPQRILLGAPGRGHGALGLRRAGDALHPGRGHPPLSPLSWR